jgi:hypothetical protein
MGTATAIARLEEATDVTEVRLLDIKGEGTMTGDLRPVGRRGLRLLGARIASEIGRGVRRCRRRMAIISHLAQ